MSTDCELLKGLELKIEALLRYEPTQEIRYDYDGEAYEVAACHEAQYGRWLDRDDVLRTVRALAKNGGAA